MKINTSDKPDLIWKILNDIPDPEVPALSIVDLGVVRNVTIENEQVLVTITPTYSGCPAIKVMQDCIEIAFKKNNIENYKIKTDLYPPWTTDWMSAESRLKLKNYGIAPPEISTEDHLKSLLSGKRNQVTCPFCNSKNTTLTSAFGSTACKALHFCNNCNQPFEEFKCH